jgi:hypothetical protein
MATAGRRPDDAPESRFRSNPRTCGAQGMKSLSVFEFCRAAQKNSLAVTPQLVEMTFLRGEIVLTAYDSRSVVCTLLVHGL